MLDNSTIIKDGSKVWITKGQKIGEVGATGHVIPGGEAGAHIHFMVVQDKNNDGSFDDNIPDGITDPFGWQSKEEDPWPNFSFSYLGQQRTGNKSFYLWTKKLSNLDTTLSSNGGGLRYSNGNLFDIFHSAGSCSGISYLWNDQNLTPSSGCNIWTTPKDDLYFVLSDSPYQPPSHIPLVLSGLTKRG